MLHSILVNGHGPDIKDQTSENNVQCIWLVSAHLWHTDVSYCLLQTCVLSLPSW